MKLIIALSFIVLLATGSAHAQTTQAKKSKQAQKSVTTEQSKIADPFKIKDFHLGMDVKDLNASCKQEKENLYFCDTTLFGESYIAKNYIDKSGKIFAINFVHQNYNEKLSGEGNENNTLLSMMIDEISKRAGVKHKTVVNYNGSLTEKLKRDFGVRSYFEYLASKNCITDNAMDREFCIKQSANEKLGISNFHMQRFCGDCKIIYENYIWSVPGATVVLRNSTPDFKFHTKMNLDAQQAASVSIYNLMWVLHNMLDPTLSQNGTNILDNRVEELNALGNARMSDSSIYNRSMLGVIYDLFSNGGFHIHIIPDVYGDSFLSKGFLLMSNTDWSIVRNNDKAKLAEQQKGENDKKKSDF